MPPAKRDGTIHGPAAKGDAIKVEMAVRAGVNVDCKDLGSFTALHWAAMKGHLTVAAVLVANRANLAPKDRKGKTPLEFAQDGGHANVSEFLFNASLLSEGKKIPPKAKGAPKLSPKGKSGRSNLSAQQQKEATKEMLAWASAIATERLDIEREEARKAMIMKKKAGEADAAKEQHQQQQKAEINRLLEALRSARETAATAGGDDSGEADGSLGAVGSAPNSPSRQNSNIARIEFDARTGATVESPRPSPAGRGKKGSSGSQLSQGSPSTARRAAARATATAEQNRRKAEQKKTLMFSGGGVSFLPEKRGGGGGGAARSLRGDHGDCDSMSATESTPSSSINNSSSRPTRLKAGGMKSAQERAETLSANAKKRAEIDRKFKEAAEKRMRKGEQARFKVEQEALEKKMKRDADRKARLGALKTGRKSPSSGSARPTTTTTTTTTISSSSATTTTTASASTPSSSMQSRLPTSSKKMTPTTRSFAGGVGSAGRKPKQLKDVRSSGYGQSPSRLPMYSGGSRPSSSIGRSRGSAGTGTTTTATTPSSLSRPRTTASAAATTSAGRPKATTAAAAARQPPASSKLKPEKTVTEMQTLEDDYIRLMQGMSNDADDAADDGGGGGSMGGGAGAGGASGRVGSGGNIIETSTAAGVGRPTAFQLEDGSEVSARSRTVVRQSGQGFGVIVHSAKHSTWIKIQNVTDGGPFGLAGVEAGDIFVAVNGTSVVGQSHKFLKKCLVSAPDQFEVVVTTELELPKTRELRTGTINRSSVDSGIGVVLYADPYSVSNGCVHRVEAGGPCDKSGIKEGDVFVEVDGANVEDIAHKDLVAIFNSAGNTIPFTVEIGGATNELPGEVASLPAGVTPRNVTVSRKEAGEPLGVVLYSDKERRGVQLQLVQSTGPFGRAGVEAGEIIVEVDMYNVLDVTHAEVNDALKHTGQSFDVAVVPADAFDLQMQPMLGEAARNAASPPGSPSKPNGLDKMRTHNVIRIPGKGLGIELKSSKNLVGTRAHNVDVAGPMAFAGVNEGDVFVHVNGTPVLNASHKSVIKAFHAAGPEFTVVVIPSDTLDGQLSPAHGAKAKSLSRSNPREMETDPYDMGKSVEVSKKQRKGVMSQVSTSNDMRSEVQSWDTTLERDRNLLFSGTSDSMELSQGYLALKKAQQEAQSLQEATKHYEHLFEQQLGSAAYAKKSPPSAGGGGGRRSPPSAGRGGSRSPRGSPSTGGGGGGGAGSRADSSRAPAGTAAAAAANLRDGSPRGAANPGNVLKASPGSEEVSWTAYDSDQNAFGPNSVNRPPKREVQSRINKGTTAATPPRRRFLNL